MSSQNEKLVERIESKLDTLISVCERPVISNGFHEEIRGIRQELNTINTRLKEMQSKIDWIEAY